MVKAEFEYHSELFESIKSKTDDLDRYGEVEAEKTLDSGKHPDIFIEGLRTHPIVFEVKRDDINPLNNDVVKQAREYAEELNTDIFVTCNSRSAFIFYQTGDEMGVHDYEYHSVYTDELETGKIVEQILQIVHKHYSEGEFPEQDEKQKALTLLSNFQSQFEKVFTSYVKNKFNSNESFRRFFTKWCLENGYEDYIEGNADTVEIRGGGLSNAEEILEKYAKQATYILANRILLYEIVRKKTPDEIGTVSDRELPRINTSQGLSDISSNFSRIQEEIDYEPIFKQKVLPVDTIKLEPRTRKELESLVRGLREVDVESINQDFLGDIYENLIPSDERKKLGQFYTHPSIANMISQWSLDVNTDGIPSVLDPASGSGTFSVEAYNIINEQYDINHTEIMDNISFVDINAFAVHLTALNLIGKDLSRPVESLSGFEGSYLDLGTKHNSKVTNYGPDFSNKAPFDSIIGNPPYIKHQQIADKDRMRNHLEFSDGDVSIPESSDAYVYFITQSTRFLTEGGRLGLIIPNKWMMTEYGKKLTSFLTENYKICGVIGFGASAFADAEVDTTTLLLEKESSETEREQNNTKFMYIKETMEPSDIISNINLDYDVDSDGWTRLNRKNYNLTIVEQSELSQADKTLKPYLYAPVESVLELYKSDSLSEMGEYVDFKRGESSGSTDFFFINEEDMRKFNIHQDMLTPALRSPKYVDVNKLEDTGWYIFDIHNYIESLKIHSDKNSNEESIKQQMKSDGYENAVDYINFAEQNEWNSTNTCQDRDVWFNLGDLSKYQQTDLVHPRNFHTDIFTVQTKNDVIPGDTFYLMKPTEEYDFVDTELIHAITNTDLYKLLIEIGGRVTGGGSLRTFGTDLKPLPFPNLEEISKEKRQEIRSEYQDENYEKITELLIESIGLDMTVKEIQDDLKTLTNIRVGNETEVMTDTNNIF